MDNMTAKRYEMLKRTRDFGTVQAAAFPSGALAKNFWPQFGGVRWKMD